MESSNRCIETGQSLQKIKLAIINEWEERVRSHIASSGRESRVILHDHMPEILDQLASTLISGDLEALELGRAHGFQRALMTDYTIAELLKELSILRETLINFLYPLGDVTAAKILHLYLDVTCEHSVTEFIKGIQLARKDPMRLTPELPQRDPDPGRSGPGGIHHH
jgi:hypothetical protein